MLSAFELKNGRLSQVRIDSRADLAHVNPIWVDLVAPTASVRTWVGEFFQLYLFNKINFLMDATVGFININQNKRVSKLTAISVVFVPINIIAGIGGISEFSMMTAGIPWPISYGTFILAQGALGFGTYHALRQLEQRKARLTLAARQRKEG